LKHQLFRTIGDRLMAFQCEASGMTGHA